MRVTATEEKTAWLEELKARRMELKRQLYAADSNSASISAGGGSKSYTNRSVADIKAKIAEIEAEISVLCEDLGTDLPFVPKCGVARVRARFW